MLGCGRMEFRCEKHHAVSGKLLFFNHSENINLDIPFFSVSHLNLLLWQHGQGTQIWTRRRVDGSQYSQCNKYTGDFAQGQRHGQGTFYYAGGAVYEGEWKNNKKDGKVSQKYMTVNAYGLKFNEELIYSEVWCKLLRTKSGCDLWFVGKIHLQGRSCF